MGETNDLDCASYGYWTDDDDVSCFDTYNASSPFYTDISVRNNIDRQWQWMLCNEPFAYWQEYGFPFIFFAFN